MSFNELSKLGNSVQKLMGYQTFTFPSRYCLYGLRTLYQYLRHFQFPVSIPQALLSTILTFHSTAYCQVRHHYLTSRNSSFVDNRCRICRYHQLHMRAPHFWAFLVWVSRPHQNKSSSNGFGQLSTGPRELLLPIFRIGMMEDTTLIDYIMLNSSSHLHILH